MLGSGSNFGNIVDYCGIIYVDEMSYQKAKKKCKKLSLVMLIVKFGIVMMIKESC